MDQFRPEILQKINIHPKTNYLISLNSCENKDKKQKNQIQLKTFPAGSTIPPASRYGI